MCPIDGTADQERGRAERFDVGQVVGQRGIGLRAVAPKRAASAAAVDAVAPVGLEHCRNGIGIFFGNQRVLLQQVIVRHGLHHPFIQLRQHPLR